MNRRGFLTSAFKATAAGLLVPEHLWGRSMVAGFRTRIYCGFDTVSDLELMKVALSFATGFSGKETLYVSPAVFPDFKKTYGHIVRIAKAP